MRLRILGIFAALALVGTPASADVRITIADGRVTVSAKDATIRQILTEWARIGQTRIVNLERVSGAPVTIELTNVPEAQALETVLRSVSGYLAAPRATDVPNASKYDRIFLLASSTAAAPTARTGTAPAAPAPVFTPPTFNEEQQPTFDEEAPRPQAPPQQAAPIRGPAFATFPQPQLQAPQQPRPLTPQTPPAGAPVGVSTPGMVVPTPQPQGQPNTDR